MGFFFFSGNDDNEMVQVSPQRRSSCRTFNNQKHAAAQPTKSSRWTRGMSLADPSGIKTPLRGNVRATESLNDLP